MKRLKNHKSKSSKFRQEQYISCLKKKMESSQCKDVSKRKMDYQQYVARHYVKISIKQWGNQEKGNTEDKKDTSGLIRKEKVKNIKNYHRKVYSRGNDSLNFNPHKSIKCIITPKTHRILKSELSRGLNSEMSTFSSG
mmetsp:Transcript_25434/g.22597  ORF Transcript_25434/g.22597 Transcript_25434/m.22597 type:complete len:138 (-) Transcript_25434:35-448(-)